MFLVMGVVHESGHWLMAAITGNIIVFKRQGFRYIWKMPVTATADERKLIAISGFGVELLLGAVFVHLSYTYGMAYIVFVALHFISYPFYAGEYNDFKYLVE